jgi:hypothetical protein
VTRTRRHAERDEWIGVEHWWNGTDWGKTEVLRDEPVPAPRYSQQLSHGLAWNWARAYTMTGQQLAASASLQLGH